MQLRCGSYIYVLTFLVPTYGKQPTDSHCFVYVINRETNLREIKVAITYIVASNPGHVVILVNKSGKSI